MSLQRCLQIVNDAPSCEPAVMLRIAFASSDMNHVNQHFGAARCFAIYRVTAGSAELLQAVQFDDIANGDHGDKLADRIDALKECDAVYCEAVGGSAISRLLTAGVQPLKSGGFPSIQTLVETLQHELSGSVVTPWIVKALSRRRQAGTDRFQLMEQEGWLE